MFATLERITFFIDEKLPVTNTTNKQIKVTVTCTTRHLHRI